LTKIKTHKVETVTCNY